MVLVASQASVVPGLFRRKQVALKWDKAFQGRADASGRAVAGVHVQAVGMVNKSWRKLSNEKRAPLGGGFKYFLCSTLFGEMIQFD